nr:laccase 3 [Tanacetum cinerariifolium]
MDKFTIGKVVRIKKKTRSPRVLISIAKLGVENGAAPNISDAITINGKPGDLFRCSSQDSKLREERSKGLHYAGSAWFGMN